MAFVAIPSALATAYYGFLASDQFRAEARFAVRSGAMTGTDMLSSLTGVPSIQIIQDTQVVTSYIASRAMVEHLQKTAGFTPSYTTDKADYFTRLEDDAPIEESTKYWQHMAKSSIQMPAGTVSLTVRAFRPEDAMRLTNAVVDASEELVNEMNERARQDALRNATNDLKFAADRLAKTRTALEVARNREGMLDAAAESKVADTLVTALRERLLELRAQYDATSRSVSADAPQLRTLRLTIAATEKQVADVQAELTRAGNKPGTGQVLSAAMTRMSVLELERQVAEQQYTSAASALERARTATLNKQIYLTTFVRPALAEEGRYPQRLWMTSLIIAGGLAAWGVFCGLSVAIRGYF